MATLPNLWEFDVPSLWEFRGFGALCSFPHATEELHTYMCSLCVSLYFRCLVWHPTAVCRLQHENLNCRKALEQFHHVQYHRAELGRIDTKIKDPPANSNLCSGYGVYWLTLSNPINESERKCNTVHARHIKYCIWCCSVLMWNILQHQCFYQLQNLD